MEPGRVLADRYEITRAVATGASGTVWAALDRERGLEVAIKAVSMEEAGWRAEVRDRLVQEARLLEMTPHPNLVGVHGHGETDDGWLFLVLELLHGETLAERLARPPRPGWREAARIALGVARGLEALHARGIVHRDLKPANVILAQGADAPEPVPKIIDLGIGKARAAAADPVLFATLTATGQVLGTPQYMSYEQALGERDIDARSDLWSLGIVLFELCAGRLPFEAPNVNATLAAIRRGDLPDLAALAPAAPRALCDLVARCLERDRERRWTDAAALAGALEAALALPDDASGRERKRPPRARPRALVAIVAGATVLAALVAVGAVTLGDDAAAGSDAGSPTAAPSAAPRVTAATAPTAEAPPASTAAGAPLPIAPASAAAPRASTAPSSTPAAHGDRRPRPRVTGIDDAGF